VGGHANRLAPHPVGPDREPSPSRRRAPNQTDRLCRLELAEAGGCSEEALNDCRCAAAAPGGGFSQAGP
jgi:hypothetical protein